MPFVNGLTFGFYLLTTMLFGSSQFLVFFLISVGLYYSIPHRFRWMLLLGASYYFYMCWKVEYVFILLASTLVNYTLALRMASIPEKPRRKKYLWIGILFNIGMLFLFKYFNFFGRSLNEMFHAWNLLFEVPLFHMLLPVGISFYTFQVLGYTIDVYNGRVPAERHPGIFALFAAFWPQLLAGPINRAHLLMPQFRKNHAFDYPIVTDGLRLMLWGLLKKVVIADHLAVYVNRVYNHVGDYQGIPLIIATVFYTIQIYCDFSGYTDMARGGARVMGYELMGNFDRPYFSKSVREFWQRWHISLSSWFRDYLYFPLGGSRVVKWRWYYNLLITFLLSGLWHGANWTFLIWGAFHGCVLILENVTGNFQQRLADRLFPDKNAVLNRAVQVGVTMTMVAFGWIFFRADSLGQALTIIRKMFFVDLNQLGIGVVGAPFFIFLMVVVLMLFLVEMKEEKGRVRIQEIVGRFPFFVRWMIYTVAVWAVFISSVFGVKQEFIYFQF